MSWFRYLIGDRRRAQQNCPEKRRKEDKERDIRKREEDVTVRLKKVASDLQAISKRGAL